MTLYIEPSVVDWTLEVFSPSTPQLYQIRHWLIGSPYRDGRPEVAPMMPVHKSYFDEQWQEFSFAMFRHFTPAFSLEFAAKRWTSLFGNALALANGTGFPGRRNYILPADLKANETLAYDKTRSMGGNVVTGYEMDGLLYVETLNGNEPPPLLEWVLERPWYYFHCVLAWPGRVGLFPQGCVRDDDIWQPTVQPLVSRTTVAIELDKVRKLPAGYIPSPYILE